MVKNLIFDGNNLCNIHFYGNKNSSEDEYIGMCFQGMIQGMNFIYEKFKPNRVVVVFDNGSWRKLYTKDLSNCVTHLKYKGTRNNNKSPSEIERRRHLMEKLKEFETVLRDYTNIVTLSGKLLEADDLIAGFVDHYPDDKHVIVSSDKDFMQLISDRVELFNPVSGEFRTLDEHLNDANFYLFEKCFRGDKASDNIMSSYPRLARKKIEQAYTDDYLRTNLLNHQFSVEHINEEGELVKYDYTTKDVFEENKYLLCLRSQPDIIKERIKEVINRECGKDKTCSMFHFAKFCSEFDLPNIIKNLDRYTPMLKTRKKVQV